MSNRPFHVHRIPNSNLLLVVINSLDLEVKTATDILSTDPIEMETGLQYGVVHPCHKLYMNFLPRRRLDECFVSFFLSSPLVKFSVFINFYFANNLQTEHPDEEETAYCGLASQLTISVLALFLHIFYILIFS